MNINLLLVFLLLNLFNSKKFVDGQFDFNLCKNTQITKFDFTKCINGEHLLGGPYYGNHNLSLKCICIQMSYGNYIVKRFI